MPKNRASARPRSRSAKVWTTIARAAGNMIAPPAPWMTRKVTSQASARLALGGEPAQRRRAREHDHAERDHLPVADRVGEPAAEGEQGRQRKQVGVDRPLDAGRAQAQFLLDLRHGDRHDRLVDERHRDREDHAGQDQAARSSGDSSCRHEPPKVSGDRSSAFARHSPLASARVLDLPRPIAGSGRTTRGWQHFGWQHSG